MEPFVTKKLKGIEKRVLALEPDEWAMAWTRRDVERIKYQEPAIVYRNQGGIWRRRDRGPFHPHLKPFVVGDLARRQTIIGLTFE